jgi:ATP-binding cassette subfamily C (CFTR/MRP) protein 10
MPLLSACVTFIVQIARGGDMTPAKVFSTLSVFIIIRFPFSFIPLSISGWVQTMVAINRIETFLMVDEVDSTRETLPYVHAINL